MFHDTKAPDQATNCTNLISVSKGFIACEKGLAEEILTVNSYGKPSLIMDKSGVGRLVRLNEAQWSMGRKQVYVTSRKFHCATPFDQPLSVILLVYEKALAQIKK